MSVWSSELAVRYVDCCEEQRLHSANYHGDTDLSVNSGREQWFLFCTRATRSLILIQMLRLVCDSSCSYTSGCSGDDMHTFAHRQVLQIYGQERLFASLDEQSRLVREEAREAAQSDSVVEASYRL